MTRGGPAPARPVGTVTRGTTGPNRLRRVDRWIVHRLGRQLRTATAPVVVDLGFGASPVTTLELAERLARRVGPGIRVVGVEIDPARVAQARRIDAPHVALSFATGGFELGDAPPPTLVRALNVLRQYPLAAVQPAWELTAGRLAPGGILVDGTCDELGRLAAWVAIPAADGTGGRPPVAPETLTISVDLRTLERPSRVAERLPKVLIHRNVPGEGVHRLLADLDRAWDRAATRSPFGPRQRWLTAVGDLRSRGVPVLDGPARWRLGELTVPWSSVAPLP